jgi:hypothetical protein
MPRYTTDGTKILQHDDLFPLQGTRVVMECATPEIAERVLALVEYDLDARVRGFKEGLGEEREVLAQLLGTLVVLMRSPQINTFGAEEIKRLIREVQEGGKILRMH